jgi:hypothetical protein
LFVYQVNTLIAGNKPFCGFHPAVDQDTSAHHSLPIRTKGAAVFYFQKAARSPVSNACREKPALVTSVLTERQGGMDPEMMPPFSSSIHSLGNLVSSSILQIICLVSRKKSGGLFGGK